MPKTKKQLIAERKAKEAELWKRKRRPVIYDIQLPPHSSKGNGRRNGRIGVDYFGCW